MGELDLTFNERHTVPPKPAPALAITQQWDLTFTCLSMKLAGDCIGGSLTIGLRTSMAGRSISPI